MSRGYAVQYPDEATSAFFDRFLSALGGQKAKSVAQAILSLEKAPRPSDPALNYVETEPEKLMVLLGQLPGKPFKKEFVPLLDYLHARHHITVGGITVVYAIDDARRYVWLMGIRKA